MSTLNLTDPRLYEKVRRPLLEAETMPRECFSSPEFYELEIERIFMKVWIFIGRVDEIPNPGDYMVFEHLGGGPIIVLRDTNGGLHAFANACRHRGSQLLSGRGNCGRDIICPYHGWCYALDGTNVGMPSMEKTKNFDKSDYGLIPVKIDAWGGFMFVNFDPDSDSLLDYLGDFPEQLGSYNCSELVCVRRKDYDLATNWKLYMENNEFYHTVQVHGETIGQQVGTFEETRGQWQNLFMPSEDTIAVFDDGTTPFPQIETLEGKAAEGCFFPLLYPNTMLATTKDCMWWLTAYPKGPEQTQMSYGYCFPKSTTERPDFEKVVQHYFYRWDKSMPEDDRSVERQLLGLKSRLWSPGRLSWVEPGTHAFDNWVLDRILKGVE